MVKFLFTLGDNFLFIIGYTITKTSSRPFLSWQTWDLLRLMYYGFKGFCEDFLTRNPGYVIFPIRLNGSAIKSFFSRLKHTTSGHLSGDNYANARASVLTRGSTEAKHSHDYRDVPLCIRKHSLQKTKYRSQKSD